MRVIEEGHVYQLSWLDGFAIDRDDELWFMNREPGHEHPGTQNQEVLRALIDRVKYLDVQRHWDGNAQIIHHLRMALLLHEQRALEQKVEKGEIEPEHVATGKDGHFCVLMDDKP